MTRKFHFAELHICSSIRYEYTLFGNYFLKCYIIIRILISFNCFSEYTLYIASSFINVRILTVWYFDNVGLKSVFIFFAAVTESCINTTMYKTTVIQNARRETTTIWQDNTESRYWLWQIACLGASLSL